MHTKRLFIGIPLPALTQEILANHSADLPISPSALNIVRPVNYHVTLVFIGATFEEALPSISAAADAAASTIAAFAIHTERIAVLPPRNPHAVVATIAISHSLQKLYDTLTRSLAAHKLMPLPHRPFFPHVTLGRIRQSQRAEDRGSAQTYSRPCVVRWDVDAIVVYESRLAPGGSHYTILHTTYVQA